MDPAPRWPALLGAAYAGQVLLLPASPAAEALRALAWAHLTQAFGDPDPTRSWAALPEGQPYLRLSAARDAVLEDPALWLATRDWLVERHAPLARVAFDRPRLRGVFGGMHTHPKARMAYAAHRDTWYGNPEAQVNLWLALHPIPQAQAVAFWPGSWGQEVPNDSAGFDLGRWEALGGWQRPDPAKAYPHALALPDVAVQHGRDTAEALAFSAALLHGAVGFAGPLARFTLELRLVPLDEVEAQRARLRGDNRSQGSTLPGLLRADTLQPLGAATPAGR